MIVEHRLSNHPDTYGFHETISISSTGRHMLVNFVTDHEVIRYGFSAKIHYMPINPICKNWLNTATRFLTSPNYPALNCSWVITASIGSTISIQFQAVEVKNFRIFSDRNWLKIDYKF